MKQKVILVLAFSIVLLISPVAFAMGGSAPEIPEKETATAQPQTSEAKPVAVKKEVAGRELGKARIELTSLEAERQNIESYLENLNKEIIDAIITKNAKKLSKIWTMERAMSDKERRISQNIVAIKQKYPELKPGEVAESVKMEKPKAVGRNVVYHDVVMGDTLMGISRKYFGTPAHHKEIAAMNNISDSGELLQGTSLMIDLSMGGGRVGTVAKAHKDVQVSAASGIVYHVVVPGDTLMSISRQYFDGSASYYEAIADMNGIADAGQLKVGMRLKIDKSIQKKTVEDL
ncbi:MAG: LysM domain-containing protein [bacterium]